MERELGQSRKARIILISTVIFYGTKKLTSDDARFGFHLVEQGFDSIRNRSVTLNVQAATAPVGMSAVVYRISSRVWLLTTFPPQELAPSSTMKFDQ